MDRLLAITGPFLLLVAFASARADEPARRSGLPHSALPAGGLLRVVVDDVPRLRAELAETLPARVLVHTAWRPVRDALTELADTAFAQLVEGMTGLQAGADGHAAELLARLSGTGILDLDASRDGGSVEWTIGADVQGEHDEIAGVIEHAFPSSRGTANVVGSGWVALASSHERLAALAAGAAMPERESQDTPSDRAGVPARFAPREASVTARIDLVAVGERLTRGLSEREVDDLRVLVRAAGLDAFADLHIAAGVRDGVVETAHWIGLEDAPRGLVDVCVRGAGELDDLDSFLALVPSSASGLVGVAVRAGAFLRGLDGLARRRLPELAPALDALFVRVRDATGLSVREDLFPLAETRLVAFVVLPGVRGLAADPVPPDVIVIARTEELDPTWRLVERVADHAGVPARSLAAPEGGQPAAKVVVTRPLLAALARRWTGSGRPPGVVDTRLGRLAPALCRLDIEEGWSVVALSVPALIRFRDRYRTERKIVYDPGFAELARESLAGATFGACLRDRVAAFGFDRELRRWGPAVAALGSGGDAFEPALLPPVESFLAASRAGGLRLECTTSGFGLRTRGDGTFVASLAALGLSYGFQLRSDPDSGATR